MKWEIWGKEGDDGPTFTLIESDGTSTSGKSIVQLVSEQGERKYTEFETPEYALPEGIGPSRYPEEAMRHFRVAALMSNMYYEGLADGQVSPYRECAVHGQQVHGGEAEELRKGIEEIVKYMDAAEDSDDLISGVRRLKALLEEVDARDSLAYRETVEGKIRGYTRFMQKEGPKHS